MKQTLKYIYERLLDIVKIAEGKYSITIALASGVIVLGGSFLSELNIYVRVLAGGVIIFSLISVVYSFVALFARSIRIRKKNMPKHINNLTYYKEISKYDEKSYVEAIKQKYGFPKSYKPDEMDYDLARSVIAEAKVIKIKFMYFNLSLFFLILSIVLAVGMVLVLGGI